MHERASTPIFASDINGAGDTADLEIARCAMGIINLLSVAEQYCPIPKSLAIASRREAATAAGAARSVVARLIRLIKSQLSRYDCARRLDYLLDAVASIFLGDDSRFGELNSRLGRANSRFVALREFAGKGLICLTVFAVKRRLRAENG